MGTHTLHTIRSIEILGFRGQAKMVKIDFNRRANFIIGRNGTGKTTLINLINAALSNETSILRRTEFKSLTIKLQKDGSRKVPSIQVVKDIPTNSNSVIYIIKEFAGSESKTYFAFRQGVRRVRMSSGQIASIRENVAIEDHASPRELNKRLTLLYDITWLSLQRSKEIEEADSEDFEEFGSDVDKRLSQVFTDLIRYFSRLDRNVAERTIEFQKEWFLSFLTSNISVSFANIDKINLEQEKNSLKTIFDRFEMSENIYRDRLEDHFKEIQKIHKRKDKLYKGIGEIALLIDTMRLHSLVEKWEELQESQQRTYKPKLDFIKITSDMLFRKRIEVNRSNQAVVLSDSGSEIPLSSLSSGEKQLLIFLAETLLQEGQSRIFLADEPELSLHVEWQNDLVPSLLDINPNAQVIFATHSPDVVGGFQDNIIEMKKVTS